MKRTTVAIMLVIGLFLFFMLWSFGSLAANKSKKLSQLREAPQTGHANSSRDHDQDLRERSASFKPPERSSKRDEVKDREQGDPGRPKRVAGKIDEATYLQQRDEYVAMRRGIEPGLPYDPGARGKAIQQMEEQESQLAGKNTLLGRIASLFGLTPNPPVGPTWTPIGPFSIPNGSEQPGQPPNAVSGRVTAIAVDPTNSNKVYLGTAQGGVWRSTDGGTTWAPIFDNAQSLAIGALAIAPSSPSTLYVGTGEANQLSQGGTAGGAQSFFGVGLYRIDNADTSATLVGPINPQITTGRPGGGVLTYNVFTGRSISKVLVHPTDPATIFVSTTGGFAGSGGTTFSTTPPMAPLGLFRSTNATSAAGSVIFQKLVVTTANSIDSPPTGNDAINDLVMEPGNPNNVLAAVMVGNNARGGIYRTINALDPSPTFTQTLSLSLVFPRIALTINKVGSTVTVYAATGETPTSGCGAPNSGAARMSTDGGATWSGQIGGYGFCGGQCLYTMTIAVNPNDASEVYLGGGKHDSCGGEIMQKESGGGSLIRDDNGLHVDSHVLVYDGAGNIFIGNDGGVWKRSSSAVAGSAWTNLNNAPLNTLQFEGLAVHPTDRNFTIGGTQDNGTEYQLTSPGNWRNAEGGDGGYELIDQSATDTTNVTMYHNFSHLRPGNFIGFDRIINTSCLAIQDSWPARGSFSGNDLTPACDGTAFYIQNGLNTNDNSSVYAPMALGPGTPNTLYYGTDRLYRSTDRGDSMTVVSQASISNPGGTGSPISTIAISPQDDNYRVVGLQNGQVWATSTGSSTLVNITSGSFPANPNGSTTNKFVGRAVIDPNNKNVAYVAFSFFAPAGQGVWKITNLGAAAGSSPVAPVWSTAGNGIPSIPINSFVIDPTNSNNLFAGTDIGVYNSTDGGATWNPYGTGLPRVAVFDMAIQNPNRILRIATFGRGMWETSLSGPRTIIKTFGAADIAVNGSTSLSFTITNPTSGTPLTGIGFTDTLPSGLVVATSNGLSGSCGGGVITAVAGSNSISLAGASLAANVSCTFSVNVQGTSAGTKTNTTGNLSSNEGLVGGTASAIVTVCPQMSIVCPGGITKFTDSGQNTATVDPGTPVVTGGCAPVTVTSVRSDGKSLNAPFPVGVTIITWTAKDTSGNAASCGQSIAVMVPSGQRRKP